MSSPEKLLPVLSPPAEGWKRLMARRDAPATASIPWLPFVSGSLAATVLAAFFLVSRDGLQMQLNGARLMGERSQGIGLQMLDNRQPTALPSGDPNVRLYWVEPVQPPSD